ncbi:hypothetical protein C0J52_09934 [Blattella germanica]|nr:hypothetical protein C0J52_09934 [Blattella germanica]
MASLLTVLLMFWLISIPAQVCWLLCVLQFGCLMFVDLREQTLAGLNSGTPASIGVQPCR